MAWMVVLAQMLTPAQDMAALEPSVGKSWDRTHAERERDRTRLKGYCREWSTIKHERHVWLISFYSHKPNLILRASFIGHSH